MKKTIVLSTILLTLVLPGAHAQPGQVPPPPAAAGTMRLNLSQGEAPKLTKFSLDFPGGTPKQLVAAIQKAMSKPINVIIQDADANEQLPPLKMSDVTLPDLFRALGDSSIKSVPYVTSTFYGGGYGGGPSQSYQLGIEGYSFKTSGVATDESVWYFAVTKTALPSMNPTKTCRYYSLASHIEAGISVEDISTAIQTGWKMMGETATPDLRFHKETKLLIAVGAPSKLETIDTVLKALQPPPAKPLSPAPKPAAAKPAKPAETDQQ